LLTARAEKTFAESGMAMGAKAYITKPFTIDSLLETITSLL
jgi:DNA-binding response OmpR family regulator